MYCEVCLISAPLLHSHCFTRALRLSLSVAHAIPLVLVCTLSLSCSCALARRTDAERMEDAMMREFAGAKDKIIKSTPTQVDMCDPLTASY